MAQQVMPPAIKRLHADLKALRESPLVGANAEPISDSDMTQWCGIIIPPESSLLAGIPLRFTLEFENEYPNVPPKAYFETFIAYQNGAAMTDSKGRIEVCLNIFGNFREIHTEWGNSSEGWSPSYTVTTILVSMQGMMVDGMLSEYVEDVKRMMDSAKKFRCPLTKHDGSDPSKYFPKVIMSPEEAAAIAQSHSSTSQTTPLDREYICYANNTHTGRIHVLGYGINIQNARLGTLSSPCEYLSWNSFKKSEIRKSSTNLPFTHWLPVLIDERDWAAGKDIRKGFLVYMENICKDIQFNGNQGEKVLKVCSSLMNSLVVEIMNNGTNLTANDKFINAYFSFYRILRMFKKEFGLGAVVDGIIQKAVEQKNGLQKKFVPNLGEFLIYLTISDKYGWKDIADPFLRECDARNVFWYAKGNHNNPPRYPELWAANVDFKDRARKVWEATGVSRKLVMFQIRFCNVAMNLGESGMFDMEDFQKYGLVDEGVRGELKGVYNQVVGVKGWAGFYEWVGIPVEGSLVDVRRGQELEAALDRSSQLKYI